MNSVGDYEEVHAALTSVPQCNRSIIMLIYFTDCCMDYKEMHGEWFEQLKVLTNPSIQRCFYVMAAALEFVVLFTHHSECWRILTRYFKQIMKILKFKKQDILINQVHF